MRDLRDAKKIERLCSDHDFYDTVFYGALRFFCYCSSFYFFWIISGVFRVVLFEERTKKVSSIEISLAERFES